MNYFERLAKICGGDRANFMRMRRWNSLREKDKRTRQFIEKHWKLSQIESYTV